MFAICLVFIRHGVYPQFYDIAKFGWVKLWQIALDLPNSPKFSSATVLRYMVARKFNLLLHNHIRVHTYKIVEKNPYKFYREVTGSYLLSA